MLSPGVLFVLVSINLSNIHKRGYAGSLADLSAIAHGESRAVYGQQTRESPNSISLFVLKLS